VAALLADAGADKNLVAAGYLHDTIENQEVTHAELVEAFDLDVADLVAHVTDDKRLPKDRRKRLQVEHAPHLPPRAQMPKMARQDRQFDGTARQPACGVVNSAARRVLRVGARGC